MHLTSYENWIESYKEEKVMKYTDIKVIFKSWLSFSLISFLVQIKNV